MIWLVITLAALIALVLFAVVISTRIEHGEARFDSRTGKQITDTTMNPSAPARPAKRMETNSDQSGTEE